MDVFGTADQMYDHLQKAGKDSKSLLKKYLKKDVFDKVKGKKTKLGGTLEQCINSGVVMLNSSNGVYACDVEGYDTFSELFDPILKDYHNVKMSEPIKHPAPDFGNLDKLPFGDLDPENKYILSTRVRVGRSAAGYAFPPSVTDAARAEIESKMKSALEGLPEEYKGNYYSLETMSKADEQKLIDDHYLFNNSDKYAEAAGVYRSWPKSRGIFLNKKSNFLVWINEEDHFRLISMQKGGNLKEVYQRLIKGIQLLEKKVPFAHSDRLGYVTFCPTNLGTTMRASVHVKIPNLANNPDKLKEICEKYKLQPRGIHGEHTETTGGVHDISNKRRLGLTEIQAATEMADGVKAIIAAEKACTPK